MKRNIPSLKTATNEIAEKKNKNNKAAAQLTFFSKEFACFQSIRYTL